MYGESNMGEVVILDVIILFLDEEEELFVDSIVVIIR